jgi:hypothetical protein
MAYQRVTLATLEQRLKEKVGNVYTFWNEAEVRDALNEGICYWHALTGEWTATRNLTATGEAIQDVPSQCASVYRVSYVSSINLIQAGTPLVVTSESELDNGFPSWETITGTPSMWAPLGVNKIAFYPVPLAGGYFVLEHFKEAPTLTSAGDFIDVGDEEIIRILGYAQWYLAFKEGVKEAAENVDPLLKQMVQAATTRNKRLLESSFYREYMGSVREEEQRPSRSTVTHLGARGDNSGQE